MVITIDGPTGAGKSTISKAFAERHDYTYINSGAFYRTATYVATLHNHLHENLILDKFLFLYKDIIIPACNWKNNEMQLVYTLDKVPYTHTLQKELFNPSIDVNVPYVSAQLAIREAVNTRIREICKSEGNWIIEGRDAATKIMPDASFQFYLDASLEERAKRRSKQYYQEAHIDTVMKAVQKRDKIDQNKGDSSLKKLNSYYIIESSHLSIEEILNKLYNIVYN